MTADVAHRCGFKCKAFPSTSNGNFVAADSPETSTLSPTRIDCEPSGTRSTTSPTPLVFINKPWAAPRDITLVSPTTILTSQNVWRIAASKSSAELCSFAEQTAHVSLNNPLSSSFKLLEAAVGIKIRPATMEINPSNFQFPSHRRRRSGDLPILSSVCCRLSPRSSKRQAL